MLIRGMGLKLGWLLFGLSLSHCFIFVSAFLVERIKFWEESFVGGLVSISLHQGSCLATGGSLSRRIFPVLWVTAKATPIDSWVPPLSHFSISSWKCPHQLQISIHFHGLVAISPVLPTPDLESALSSPFPSFPFPSHYLPLYLLSVVSRYVNKLRETLFSEEICQTPRTWRLCALNMIPPRHSIAASVTNSSLDYFLSC